MFLIEAFSVLKWSTNKTHSKFHWSEYIIYYQNWSICQLTAIIRLWVDFHTIKFLTSIVFTRVWSSQIGPDACKEKCWGCEYVKSMEGKCDSVSSISGSLFMTCWSGVSSLRTNALRDCKSFLMEKHYIYRAGRMFELRPRYEELCESYELQILVRI